MKARLFLFWDSLRSSYWFIPVLMLFTSAGLAVSLVALDQHVDTRSLRGLWWIFSGGAEGARSLLSAVAGSVIGVAGTTFSITIAVLSLTSSQFGSRLLRGFLQDQANQFVLGTFIGTFLYCLLVLRTVRSVEEVTFVPHIAVTGGVVLAIASVILLIFFIHHVSGSIQASYIIAKVAGELEETIDRLFPEGRQGSDDAPAIESVLPLLDESVAHTIRATMNGYVQAVNDDALFALAEEKDLLIRLEQNPGQFVVRGCPLVLLYSRDGSFVPDPKIAAKINAAYSLGINRTAAQDAEFLLLQLVEIAVRALSSGINDPYTAIICLDYISASLCHLAGRVIPGGARANEKGEVRLVQKPLTFADMVDTGFRQIHHFGKADPVILERLQEVLTRIESCARTEEQREVLRQAKTRFNE